MKTAAQIERNAERRIALRKLHAWYREHEVNEYALQFMKY